MSESADSAILEVSGLKPTRTFEVYRIWWMPKRGAPIWAADFLVGDDGLATVPVDLPSGREKEMSLSVTLENESYSDAPNGPIVLKGELSPLPGARKSRRLRLRERIDQSAPMNSSSSPKPIAPIPSISVVGSVLYHR